jgi:hypothetical protein
VSFETGGIRIFQEPKFEVVAARLPVATFLGKNEAKLVDTFENPVINSSFFISQR